MLGREGGEGSQGRGRHQVFPDTGYMYKYEITRLNKNKSLSLYSETSFEIYVVKCSLFVGLPSAVSWFHTCIKS